MVIVNGGFLHCTDIKKNIVNSSLKVTKKKKNWLEQSQKKSGERSRAILALFLHNIIDRLLSEG